MTKLSHSGRIVLAVNLTPTAPDQNKKVLERNSESETKQKSEFANIDRKSKDVAVLYVTPFSRLTSEGTSSAPVRKDRRSATNRNLSPPSTSYGVPLLPQEPIAENLSTSLDSTAQEETNTNQPKTEQNYGYYLPPQEEDEQEITVNRNIYFYKAPKDFEQSPTKKTIPLPKPQKNYKVIFIKAPSVPVPPPVVQLAPQNEDKTLVYVLVKKPEEQPDILIPTPATTEASKPEVYFIKYGTEKENVKNSEKKYGVSQYGKGYFYGQESSEENSNEDKEQNKNDSEEKSNKESSKENKRVERQNYKYKNVSKRNGYIRGTRSSFDSSKISNDESRSRRYFAPLQQRSSVYE